MMKRLEVQVLRRAGHSQAEVAALTGVPVRTIRRIETEAAVVDADTTAQRRQREVGRPQTVGDWRPFVERVLAEEPALMTLEILRRARADGYQGGKTPFYDLVAQLRPRVVSPMVRFEGLAGEFSQHDFGQVDVRFVDGACRRVHFFASRLKYSRWVQVTLVPDQRVESLLRPLVAHFEAFGGTPLVAVFDRPKTIALKWKEDGTVTTWNPTFADVVLQLGVGVELCWPYMAWQKGSVENLVGRVKGSFFKPRRFLDDADLIQQLADWHVCVDMPPADPSMARRAPQARFYARTGRGRQGVSAGPLCGAGAAEGASRAAPVGAAGRETARSATGHGGGTPPGGPRPRHHRSA